MRRQGPAVLESVLAGLILLMTFQIVLQVILREFTSFRLADVLDQTSYWWMPAIAFLGLAVAEWRSEHIEATFVSDHIHEPRLKMFLGRSAELLTITAIGLLVYPMVRAALEKQRLGERAAASGTLVWPMRYVAVAGVVMFLIARLGRLLSPPRS